MPNDLIETVWRTVLAAVLFGTLLYSSWLTTLRYCSGLRFAMRWLAFAIIAIWLSSVVFFLLLLAKSFTLPWSIALSVALAVLLRRCIPPVTNSVVAWKRDMKRLVALLSPPRRQPDRIIHAGLLLAVGLLAVRVLVIPPLGWDAMSYHAVKAGLWIQSGQQYDLVAPSGWTCYRTFPGGAEIPLAWVMLPFRSDLLTGLLDWWELAFTALATYALCRQLGVRSRSALIAGLFFVSLPPLSRAVGALYSDTLLTMCFISAICFAIEFVQRRTHAAIIPMLMSLGLMAGIKVTGGLFATAIFAWLLGYLAIQSLRCKANWPWRELLLGTGAAAVVALPWYAYAMLQTGFPLSPMPVEVLGATLGLANPEMHYYQTNLKLRPYHLRAELGALSRLFAFSFAKPTVTILGLLPCIVFLPALAIRFRNSPAVVVLLLTAATSIVIAYFQPGFSVVRLMWATDNGRFVMPFVSLAVAASLAVDRWKNNRRLRICVATFALVNFGFAVGLGASSAELWGYLLIVPAVMLAGIAALLLHRVTNARLSYAALGLVGFIVFPAIQITRDHIRYLAVERSVILHTVSPYWWQAARKFDDREQPRCIAVTAGVLPTIDNLMIYYFLGNRLQNHLTYVPITKDGEVFHFGRTYREDEFVTCHEWIDRLLDGGVTDVISFYPRTRELEWMESRPDVFKPADADGEWGAYTLRRASRNPP